MGVACGDDAVVPQRDRVRVCHDIVTMLEAGVPGKGHRRVGALLGGGGGVEGMAH